MRSASIPTSDASVPKTTSHTAPPVSRFDIMQPSVTPGIAAGVSTPRMHSASEIRNCITPLERPQAAATSVSTV